jgi:hypothetical protein
MRKKNFVILLIKLLLFNECIEKPFRQLLFKKFMYACQGNKNKLIMQARMNVKNYIPESCHLHTCHHENLKFPKSCIN